MRILSSSQLLVEITSFFLKKIITNVELEFLLQTDVITSKH